MTAYRPDLTVTAPARAQAGRPLAITHTVRNVGPAPAGAFAMRFYLSSDDALDAGDVLLGTRMIASPGAGASR
jgi:subtilase family serine protease